MLYKEITSKILKSYFKVYNVLSYGFLEKVYENAMLIELRKNHLEVKQQSKIKVYYDKIKVGDYYADLIVNDKVIIELKAASSLCEEHEHQLLNYLRATNKEVGLLLNFGIDPQYRRLIFTNDRKKSI